MTDTTAENITDLIEGLLPWGGAYRVQTRRGARMLRKAKADPTPEFWEAWREHKVAMKEAGISVSRNQTNTDWEVCWWQPLDEETLAKEKAAVEASRATDAAIAVPRGEAAIALGHDYLPFQRGGIAYAMERHHCLIADEMGLGKGVMAVGVANMIAEKLGRRVLALVIVPASLRLNWQREWQKWSIRRDDIPWVVNGGDAGAWPVHVGHDGASPNLVIMNYDVASKHATAMRRTRWDLLICDEAHAMKSPDAQRTIAILGGGDKRSKGKYVPPLFAAKKLFLTGTPIINRPREMWTLASALCPTAFRDKWKFENRYCAATQGQFGRKADGASNLDELQEICRREFMVRRLKKDVLKELPPKRRQVLEVVGRGLEAVVAAERDAYAQKQERILAAKAKVELAKAEDDKAAYREAVESLRSEVSMTIGEMAEMRQVVALAKVPIVVDHVLSLADSVGKVVVFAHHKKVVQALMDGLAELNPVKVAGDVKMEDRDAAVKAFQTDPGVRCFIGNIAAAGVGITLVASSTVVFAELDWTPAGMSQCEDRCARIGQVNSVLVQHIVLDGSIDAHMAKMLVTKQEILDLALDQETQPDEPEPDGQPVTLAPPAATEGVARSHFHTAGAMLTREEIEAAHRAVRLLAQVCDFARAEDGAGFNATDARMGHELASRASLSPAAAALAARIAVRYAGTQLDAGTAALVRSAAARVEQAKDAAKRPGHSTKAKEQNHG